MAAPWRTRTLSRNHACQRPSSFIFVDIETRPLRIEGKSTYSEHHFRLGCACHVTWPQGREPQEEWLDFSTPEEFWTWAKRRCKAKRVLWVYAHNALFDLTMLRIWDKIGDGSITFNRPGKKYRDPKTGAERQAKDWVGVKCIDGMPFWLECEWEGQRVNFVDSMNYYNCSLAELGRSVGIVKLNMPEFKDPDGAWRIYCRNDVDILKAGMIDLMREWASNDNGNWQPTAASLAWSNYRHKHMPGSVVIHQHANAKDIERAAYYGGECRAFYQGTAPGPVAHYDVNSLYPSVMHGNYYPCELIDYVVCPQPGIFEDLLKRYEVIAEVTLDTTRDDYPLRSNGRVIYPIGKYRTAIAGPELRVAWLRGSVVDIHAAAYYRRDVLFSSYVEQWYAAKAAARAGGNRAREQLAKLMLNSLYGKWAQRSPMWEDEPKVDVVQPWKSFPWRDDATGNLWPARSVGWTGQVARYRRDCEHTFTAVAAYITSYARVRMREIRSLFNPSFVYYQDTDSIFVDHMAELGNGPRMVPLGTGLGELRRVGTYSSMTIRGPKNYTVDGKHIIAGVRSKDVHLGGMKWSGERFERSGSILSRHPDGNIRSWPHSFDTPGGSAEGGYDPGGWYIPQKLA